MIRLTWRQLRGQAAVAGIGLAVVALVLGLTGPHLAHVYDTTVATCAAHGDCGSATGSFLHTDSFLQTALNLLVLAVPALLGMFWGAPLLARELESGTFRMAWTQSVTRTRWLVVKAGLAGLAALVVTGLLSFMVTWWFSPIDRVQDNRLSSLVTFSARDIVPLGYTAFAFALGIAAGAILHRTLPAMASTLGGLVAVWIVVGTGIRPMLMSALHRNFPLNPSTTGYGFPGSPLSNGGTAILRPSAPNFPGAWVYSTQVVSDRTGRALTSAVIKSDCPGLVASAGSHRSTGPSVIQALHDCVVKIAAAYHGVATYQPGSRFWAFQSYELAILAGAALVLAGLGTWWIRHRLR